MTVNELIDKLLEVKSKGYGEYDVASLDGSGELDVDNTYILLTSGIEVFWKDCNWQEGNVVTITSNPDSKEYGTDLTLSKPLQLSFVKQLDNIVQALV